MPEKVKRHPAVSILLFLSFFFVLAGFVWAMISLGKMNEPFILHFDDLQGITAIGGRGLLVFMGIFGMVMVLINGSLAFELETRNGFLGKLIAVLTLILSGLLFIAFAAILSVN